MPKSSHTETYKPVSDPPNTSQSLTNPVNLHYFEHPNANPEHHYHTQYPIKDLPVGKSSIRNFMPRPNQRNPA